MARSLFSSAVAWHSYVYVLWTCTRSSGDGRSYVYEEPPPRPVQFTSLARLTVIACAHCCEVPLIQSLRHPNWLVDKDRMCYDDRSGNIWGSRDLPNVYQEPACLRRSDPFGDTCTRRTLTFGIATIALSFVACLNFVLYHL